jgi:signal transduction histidine kinase
MTPSTRGTTSRSLVAWLSTLPLALAPCAVADGAAAAGVEPEHQATRELVSLVDDAAALVAGKGHEAACAAFHEKGSRWFDDETYVFILGMEGLALCHPARPSLEGRGQIDLRDPHGRPIVQNFIRDLERAETGWEHYLWPRPGGGTNFFWKTSYVRRVEGPDGVSYVVGSGGYQMPMERLYVVDQVDDAVALLEREGEAAFATLRDPAAGFLFYDSYVFVMDTGGVHLVNAGFPENEGKNLLDLTDSDGKVIGREMLAVLETADAGWVDYLWPRPGDTPTSKKSSYVRKATLPDGRVVVVGAGLYLD